MHKRKNFVNAVCNNVLLEYLRTEKHDDDLTNTSDTRGHPVNPDEFVLGQERRLQSRRILEGLSKRDQEILRLLFFEERGISELCDSLGVNRSVVRTVLCRAKARFKKVYARSGLDRIFGELGKDRSAAPNPARGSQLR
jgi:RNA polymerase sigma factor (sigma-70 family)